MNKATNRARSPALSAICIGAANIDIRCAFNKFSVDGTSNPATIAQSVGGAALNTARMLSKNNVCTKFIGLVGNDDGADIIAEALSQADVENGLLAQKNGATGRYISLIEPDGSLKTACNDMKIHENFSPESLETLLASIKSLKVDAVFCDANIPDETIKRIFELMPNCLKCASTVSPAKAHRLVNSLPLIDVLFTNIEEAHSLLRLNSKTAIEELAQSMAISPVKSGVISNGSNPVYFWHNGKVACLPVPPIDNIVDVIGAGDALAAGTISALLNGNNFSDAVLLGIKTTQSVLKTNGAYPA